MERGFLFYFLLGAAVVGVPALLDRLLKDRVTPGARFLAGLVAAVAVAVIFVLVAGWMGY